MVFLPVLISRHDLGTISYLIKKKLHCWEMVNFQKNLSSAAINFQKLLETALDIFFHMWIRTGKNVFYEILNQRIRVCFGANIFLLIFCSVSNLDSMSSKFWSDFFPIFKLSSRKIVGCDVPELLEAKDGYSRPCRFFEKLKKLGMAVLFL